MIKVKRYYYYASILLEYRGLAELPTMPNYITKYIIIYGFILNIVSLT